MVRRLSPVACAVLTAAAISLLTGCAGTSSTGLPDDPGLIEKELIEIENDIANHKEMLKGSKAQLQIEDSSALREEIHSMEMELYELEARHAALRQRLQELGHTGSN